jgi:AraC-like DNA-binding protein
LPSKGGNAVAGSPMALAVLVGINRGADPSKLDLATIAARLGKRPRTVQHALEAEGFSYRGLLRHFRMSRAKTLLAESALSATEISRRLGYANPSTFHRAFVADTGFTPIQFRRGDRR